MLRATLKNAAKQQLSGKWTPAVLATLIVLVIAGACGAFMGMGNSLSLIGQQGNASNLAVGGAVLNVISTILYILVVPALMLGLVRFFLNIAKMQQVEISQIFWGFRYLLKVIGLEIMIAIFVFLWSLLFIIPGIIAAFRYSQAMFILAENPEIGIMDAIRQSKQMMIGHKWEYFVLELSFIGWGILATFCFIGMLWLAPYMYTTYANYYLHLRELNAQPAEPVQTFEP